MKKIDVYVKDRNTIVLESDASKGDYIDLSTLSNVDFRRIESLINDGKDQVYEKKLKEFKASLELEYDLEKSKIETKNRDKINDLEREHLNQINALKAKIDNFELEKESLVQKINYEKSLEVNNKINEINTLKLELDNLKKSFKENLDSERLKINEENNKKINELQIELVKQKSEAELKLTKEINQLKEEHRLEIIEKDNEIALGVERFNQLQRAKASLNVKQTGEDLEAWCDNEVKSYMQNGLFNCTWIKDNLVVKLEDEQKGSKADYIFKIYANENHNPDELLASVCLDMKDENPDSINKKKNSDYYKQLDNNRNKKNCKYALLVSNLELDKPNDLPIYKVSEYKDMYVVRPAYMMTFLNMLTSLTTRFSNLILDDNKEKLELQNSLELLQKFEDLKNTYLDKPLVELEKMVNDLAGHNEKIIDEAKKVKELVEKISSRYINSIASKLDKFEVNITKAYKKYERNL